MSKESIKNFKSRTVTLPLKEAVALEAKQNIQRDLWLKLLSRQEARDPEVISEYEEEAEFILKQSGHGYLPEHGSHKLVMLKK